MPAGEAPRASARADEPNAIVCTLGIPWDMRNPNGARRPATLNLVLPMTIKTFTCNPFATNTYVCHSEGEAAVVDAACMAPEELAAVAAYLEAERLTVRHLLLTHAHIDHIFGCAALARSLGQGWALHRADLPLLRRAAEQAALFGVPVEAPPEPTRFLEAGDRIAFGGAEWRVLHAPGHSPGSVCFYDEAGGYVLAGDVLFAGSIGRTDLWQGSLETLMRSIYEQLLPLPDDVAVHPGHGPSTRIGEERRSNPYLAEPGS